MVAEDRIPFFTYSRMLTDSPEVTGFLKLLVTLDRMELTALDVHYLVQELQQLTDAKVEKVYQSQTDRKDILLQMYLREWPKLFLRVQAPGLVCLEEEKPAYPQVPPAFAMFLRKYLVGARLQKAEQIGFDRIVKLAFTGKHESELILELLPPGNIIMLADGKVKNLAEQQRHKDRTIRSADAYTKDGIAYVVQDVRGLFASEGEYRAFLGDQEDGYDTVEWIAAQPWSNGKICAVGGSAGGITANLAAMTDPIIRDSCYARLTSTSPQYNLDYFGGIPDTKRLRAVEEIG